MALNHRRNRITSSSEEQIVVPFNCDKTCSTVSIVLLISSFVVCIVFAVLMKQQMNGIDNFNQELLHIPCTVYNETLIENVCFNCYWGACQQGTQHVCYWHQIYLNYTNRDNQVEYYTFIRDDASLLPNKYYDKDQVIIGYLDIQDNFYLDYMEYGMYYNVWVVCTVLSVVIGFFGSVGLIKLCEIVFE